MGNRFRGDASTTAASGIQGPSAAQDPRSREATLGEEDANKFKLRGWNSAPTVKVMEQVNSIIAKASVEVEHLAIDWSRAAQPECYEVMLILKPAPYSTSQSQGWKLKTHIDKAEYTPFGAEPGQCNDFGQKLVIKMQPLRTHL